MHLYSNVSSLLSKIAFKRLYLLTILRPFFDALAPTPGRRPCQTYIVTFAALRPDVTETYIYIRFAPPSSNVYIYTFPARFLEKQTFFECLLAFGGPFRVPIRIYIYVSRRRRQLCISASARVIWVVYTRAGTPPLFDGLPIEYNVMAGFLCFSMVFLQKRPRIICLSLSIHAIWPRAWWP